MKAPERIDTSRLILRRPHMTDAADIFDRYAADEAVTKFVGWPRHRTVDETRGFLQFSDAQWDEWPAGPYLIASPVDGRLLGSTGLMFEAPDRAMTGYVLAQDAWGRGYATEALGAMVDLAARLGVTRLYALCHPDHRASWHVLEKCAFAREATLHAHGEFPNLAPGVLADVLRYARSPHAPARASGNRHG